MGQGDGKKNVLLVCKESSEADRLTRVIGKDHSIAVVDTLEAAQKYTNNVDLVAIRQKRVGFLNRFPKDIVALSRSHPILMMSEEVPQRVLEKACFEDRIRILHMPQGDAQVLSFVSKLANRSHVPQQLYRRFYTEENSEIEVYGSGDQSQATLRNLSLGGAFFHYYPDKLDFEAGDLLQVTVNLGQIKSKRVVNAEVVWVEGEGSVKGMGVSFISNDEVFSKLMSRM